MNTEQLAVPSYTRTLGTLIWAEAIAFTRSWRSVMWTVALPALMLLLGAKGIGAAGANSALVLAICASALVTGTFALGLMGYGTVLASYRERGIFHLLRCSPAPASLMLGARLLVQLLAVLAEGVVVLLAAFLLYGVSPAPSHIGLMFALLLLSGLVALALGQAVAAFTRSAASTMAVSRVLLIGLFVLEGMGGVTRGLPDALQRLLDWSPVKLAQELLTSALVTGHLDAAAWAHLGVLAVWILVIGFAGLRWFRWESD